MIINRIIKSAPINEALDEFQLTVLLQTIRRAEAEMCRRIMHNLQAQSSTSSWHFCFYF